MDQRLGLQGLVQQNVQAGAVTSQQVIRGAFAAHGDSGDLGPRSSKACWKGLILEQFEAKPVGQLQIEQHQVVRAFSEEGAGPAQTVGLFDHAARPGILKDHTRAQPVHGVVVDHEQSWGEGGGHGEVPKWN